MALQVGWGCLAHRRGREGESVECTVTITDRTTGPHARPPRRPSDPSPRQWNPSQRKPDPSQGKRNQSRGKRNPKKSLPRNEPFQGFSPESKLFFLRLLNPVKRVPPEPGQAAFGFIVKANTSSAFQEANVAIGGGGPPAPECADAGHYVEAVRIALISRQKSRLYGHVPIRGPRHERDLVAPAVPPELPSDAPERRLAWAQYDGKGGPVTVIRSPGSPASRSHRPVALLTHRSRNAQSKSMKMGKYAYVTGMTLECAINAPGFPQTSRGSYGLFAVG